MSKDKITVSMNIHNIPTLVEELDEYTKQLEYKYNKQKEVLDKIKPMLKELKNLYDDNYTVSDKVGDILELLEEVNECCKCSSKCIRSCCYKFSR